MIRFIPAILVALVSVAVAAKDAPTTAPSKATPTTKPVQAIKPADTRSGRIVAESSIKETPVKPDKTVAGKPDEAFPTPQEMMAKIKAKQSAVDKLLKVAHFDLTQPMLERSPEFTLFGDFNLLTVHALLDRLHQARDDKNLRAVLVTLNANSSFNMAQAMEIRQAFHDLQKAGKRTFVYADSFTTPSYLAASGATDICMLSGGDLMFQGVSIEPMFMKGLFDKLGVKADMIQIGEFKGADEQYTRTELSAESKGELSRLADALYELVVDTMATSRNVSKQSIKAIIDDVFLSAKQAKDRKLIDHLVTPEELRELLKGELGGDVNILPNYAVPQREKLDFSNPMAILQMMSKKQPVSEKLAVGLIHAEGEIVDGEVEENPLTGGGTVGSENIRKAFRIASRDPNVKAIVLRIDSPGGSAPASEVMWQAVNAAAQDKPVIISVGSMAASGGYYLASAGDRIFADQSAIVGSIGVVGGKFVLHGLFEKLGITTETISRGKNADMWSMDKEWNDRQKRMVTNWMKATYEQFTERVMTNRKDKIKDIDQVARGRIFLAKQAKELGLVDEIGGLSDAIKYAANEGELKDGQYDVKLIPGSRSLLDVFSGGGGGSDVDAKMPWKAQIKLSVDSPLSALPPSLRARVIQQIHLMEVMDKRPVMLVSPYMITVK